MTGNTTLRTIGPAAGATVGAAGTEFVPAVADVAIVAVVAAVAIAGRFGKITCDCN